MFAQRVQHLALPGLYRVIGQENHIPFNNFLEQLDWQPGREVQGFARRAQ